MVTRHASVETTIGPLALVAAGETLTGIYYPGHWVGLERATAGAEVPIESDPVLAETARQLRDYLAGARTGFDLPTAADGDDFQHRVWAMLREIPFGATTTYGELAQRLGDKNLARMVGRAVGYNPLSIVVPCHRVVGKNGSLTGYAGGLERKQFLLALEAPEPAAAGRLF